MTNKAVILDLIGDELKSANNTHPPFRSLHEAYAVTREEYEETAEELSECDYYLLQLWRAVRSDNCDDFYDEARALKNRAVALIQEAIQLGAMAEKCLAIKDDKAYREFVERLP